MSGLSRFTFMVSAALLALAPASVARAGGDVLPAAAASIDGELIARPSALEALDRIGKPTKTSGKPATKSARPAGPAAQLLRAGFRATADGGQVVLHTSGTVELEARPPTGKESAVFLLKHCRVVRRNDRLPFDTRFFKSSVTGVTLKQRGRDLEISVSLRGAVTPLTRQEAGTAGSWFWVLEFPSIVEKRTQTAAVLP